MHLQGTPRRPQHASGLTPHLISARGLARHGDAARVAALVNLDGRACSTKAHGWG